MKIKMLKTVSIQTIGRDDDNRIVREDLTLFKDDVQDGITIVREKKGNAEVVFADGFEGNLPSNTFEKIV